MVSGEIFASKGGGGTMMALEQTGASDIQEMIRRTSLRIREGSKTRYQIYRMFTSQLPKVGKETHTSVVCASRA